jgi:hydroxymethylbilane synthase
MKRIILGTRASKLAMIQTHWVVERLQKYWPDLEIEIEQISTKGDHVTDKPLTQIGGDGVFVKEIENALQQKRIDLAVHSLKDLPTAQPEDMRIVAVGPREDVRDVLVTNRPFETHANLRIGTCSLRRSAQIQALFPHVEILPLRGNVDTRLRKLDAGDYDAIVLAAAGLHRLALQERLAGRINYLPIEVMMPSPGQGALAVEMRDEAEMEALVAPLVNPVVQASTSAERMFMRRLGAGCYLPVAAYGEVVDKTLTLRGLVISPDGQRWVSVQQNIRWAAGSLYEDAEQLGVRLAEQALAKGAADIIATLKANQVQEPQHVTT